MARPKEEGLKYFSFDVDFFNDEKIEAISGEFGIKGEITTIKLLCAVYRNGYFIEWNEMLKMKLLKNLPGVSSDLLDQITNRLVKWGFFDKDLFDSVKILTSHGIQKRYFEAIKRRKKSEEYPYLIINVDINTPSTGINVDINTTKASKVQKRKENITVDSNESPVCATCQPHDERIDYSELVKFFNEKTQGVFGVIRMPLSDKRKGMINARIKTYGKETFAQMIQKALNSDFLKGQNKNGWRASFDWLIKPTNFEKVISGNYDNKSGNDRTNDRSSGRDFGKFFQGIAEGIARADYEERNG